MTCYTVTTCVISDGSIPSDKGGGGGEFIQTLSPEIRGGGWAVSKKFGQKKKMGGGGGETQALPQDPPLLYRYSGFVVKFDVPGSVGLDRSSPLSFFSLWLSVVFNGTPTRGQENINEKKIESSFCFQVLYKGEIRTIRFVLVECWQRNIFYKKSVMHVQCCCFADLRSRPLESGFF